MNAHFHPMQWLHREHAEHLHLREIFHNEVFWIVTIVLAILITVTLMILLVGSPGTMYKPYTPYLPFG